MCTISWLISDSDYQVFFNRDEQVTRPIALPPRKILENNIHTIMPVDPQGGGSWCAVNEYGLTFALLNYYQGSLPKGRLISRGKLVQACAGYRHKDEALAYLKSLNHAKYAPFSLLCFAPLGVRDVRDSTGKYASVTMLRWDGKQLLQSVQTCPLISSAVRYDAVYASRLNIYHDILGDKNTREKKPADYLRLHSSHLPERSAQSICMHREDAHTVSFSQIEVKREDVTYFYTNGAPCEAALEKSATLVRR